MKTSKLLEIFKANKINIKNKEWIIFNAKIYKKNNYKFENQIKFKTNFDYEKMQSLYSNLSSLNIYQLFELRENYIRLSYSVTEVNLQILKLISLPIYLLLMTLFSASIMLRIKHIDNTTFKISIGLFCSVIIYYLNNFFHVLGSTERIPLLISVFIPIFMLILTNTIMLRKVNEK
jgi:lipopolysaccharide export system permease protein